MGTADDKFGDWGRSVGRERYTAIRLGIGTGLWGGSRRVGFVCEWFQGNGESRARPYPQRLTILLMHL